MVSIAVTVWATKGSILTFTIFVTLKSRVRTAAYLILTTPYVGTLKNGKVWPKNVVQNTWLKNNSS